MDHFNTDYTKKPQTEEEAALETLNSFRPEQHPRALGEDDASIISYKVPAKALTPYYQVPPQALAELDQVYQFSPQEAKSLECCILGAPNAGKSSLMNRLVKKNVSAISDKYNTTREATLGVYTDMDSKT